MEETSMHSPLLRFWSKGGFILCTKGFADIRINEQSYRLSEGDIMVITPLVQVYSFEPSADYEDISFLDDLKVFYPVFHLIIDTAIPLKVREMPVWSISTKEKDFILHNFDDIIERTDTMKDEGEEGRRLLRKQIELIKQLTVIEIVRHRMKKVELLQDTQKHRTIVAYQFILSLHEHYVDQRSVSWYAAQANLSPGHFTSMIKSLIGMSPSQLIEIVTTTYAKIMLEMTDKSIKGIASDLNFPEQFTFRKYFKLHTGISPKEYRLNYKRQKDEE